MHLVPDVFLDGWIDWIAQVVNLNYHFSVIPCGGSYSPRIVVNVESVKQFFASAGVSF